MRSHEKQSAIHKENWMQLLDPDYYKRHPDYTNTQYNTFE